MALEGVDYSYDRPDPDDLIDAGKHFACRYLSDEPVKNLTADEALEGAAAGLWFVVVWEAGHGHTTPPAAECAAESVRQAKAVGVPAGRPIYFAVDFDAQPNQLDDIEVFLREYAKHLSPYVAGVYGGELVVTEMLARGAVGWAWQTYAWSANRNPKAQLWQYSNNVECVGANVDLDRAYTDDYGQWQPGKTPGGTDQGDWLMALTDEQQKKLYDDVQWLKTKLTDNLFTPGTAQGQKSVGSTIAAALQTSQQVLNEVK